jgi:hypothetical protein
MATGENARLTMEVSQTPVASEIMTDSGDHTTFTGSAAPWSRVSGFTASVLPNGVKTGGVLTATAVNNQVAVSALTCNLNGVATSVAGGTLLATRTAAGLTFQITSMTVTAAGALAAVPGTEGAALVETRGAAGGPPFIPIDSIEIGQVRLTSNTDAVIAVSEIKQVPGTHKELASYPLWAVDYLNGDITFVSVLPLSHTGSIVKRTYAAYYTPVLVAIPDASDFKFPEETFTLTSVQTYDGTIASSSKSLNQGTFKAKLQDGLTDLVVVHAGENLWFNFFPDKNASAHGSCQGILGISRTFPADALLDCDCTISAEKKSVVVA